LTGVTVFPHEGAPGEYYTQESGQRNVASDWRTLVDDVERFCAPAAAFSRITGKSEVMPGTESQRRWPEVLFEEIAMDLLQARFWTASGWATDRELFLRLG
jgi:hypothetical protein